MFIIALLLVFSTVMQAGANTVGTEIQGNPGDKVLEGKRLLTTTYYVYSDDEYDYYEEKDGQEATLQYHYRGNRIEGKLYDSYEQATFNFIVERQFKEEQLSFYKGNIVDSEKEVTFYLKKIKGEQVIQINIEERLAEHVEEYAFAATYSFDGKPTNTRSFKEEINSVDSMDSAYYTHIVTHSARGIRVEVRGPRTSSKSSSPNHSIRLNTRQDHPKQDVNFAFEPKNVSVTHTRYNLTGNTATIYNAVRPISSGTTSFQFPIYLGSILGVQWVPVRTSSTSVSGTGSRYFNVNFTGPTYLDEYVSNDTNSSKNRHGILVEWKMNEGTIGRYLDSNSRATNTVNTYIRYKVDNGRSNTLYEEAHREYSTQFVYRITVN